MAEKFEFDLAISGIGQSKEAAESLSRLRDTIDKSTATIQKMQQAYKGLKIGGLQNTEVAKQLKQRLDQQKKAHGELNLQLLKMKGSLAGTAKEGKIARASFDQFAAGARLGGGPVGALTGRVSSLASVLGQAGLVGATVAAAAAVVALDVVLARHAINAAGAAIRAADGYRSENLALQGMTKAWVGWYGQIKPGKADDIQASIDRVSSSVSTGRDQVHAYAEELYRYRLRGEKLKDALEGVALAQSAAGDEAAQLAMQQILANGMWGRSISGVTARLRSQYSAINTQKMLALDVQMRKLKENTNALFRGVSITPLLSGLNKILGVLDQGSVEFKAWKTIIETVFNPLFEGADKAGGVLRAFFTKATILALRSALAWESMKGSFSLQKLGLDSSASLLENAASSSIDFALGLLRAANAGIVVARVTYNLGVVAANTAKIVWHLGAALAGLAAFEGVGDHLGKSLDSAVEGLGSGVKGLLTEDGSQMINGLIEGIEKARPKLVATMRSAARESHAAYNAEQGIKSPSTKFEWSARQEMAGLMRGRARSRGALERSSTALAEYSGPINARTPQGGMQAPAAVHWSGNIQVNHVPAGPGTVTVNIAELRTLVASIFEGVAIQAGAV